MPLQLNWVNRNTGEDGTRIYRAQTPMDLAALPEPLVSLAPGITTYLDETIERNKVYHYLFETFKGQDRAFSKEQILGVYPDTGPGPQTLLRGDFKHGYFGIVSQSELFTAAELTSLVSAPGSQYGGAIEWLKFAIDGKILFVANKIVNHSMSWDQLYNAGLVYGVDGPGPFNSGIEVNQMKTVNKGDSTFIVRLMTGTDDPATVRPTAGRPTSNSEWNRVFYPLIIGNDSLYLPSVKFDSRPASELAQLDGVGYQAFVQDVGDTTANRIIRGGSSLMHYINQIPASYSSNTGWRPVLELVL